MKLRDALRYVGEHLDDDDLDDDDLDEVFRALHGIAPDDDDRESGIWSLCCAAAKTFQIRDRMKN